tara:strand:+ start:14 stop:256 length:243 start_codon:yes stop_codon:yes gene_type:complete
LVPYQGKKQAGGQIENGYSFFYSSSYMFNTSIYIITGTKMNIDKKIQELEKQIKYIESVLKEKQDELFCLKAEKKGHKAP